MGQFDLLKEIGSDQINLYVNFFSDLRLILVGCMPFDLRSCRVQVQAGFSSQVRFCHFYRHERIS
jgi:hypothetical protein